MSPSLPWQSPSDLTCIILNCLQGSSNCLVPALYIIRICSRNIGSRATRPLARGVVKSRKGSGRVCYWKRPHKQQVLGALPLLFPLAYLYSLFPLSFWFLWDHLGIESWETHLPSILVRQLCGTNLCAPCLLIYLPGFIPKGSRKRQVMSPTMAPVPERPFTFSSPLRSQHLLLLLQLGLLIGTDNVPNFTVTGSL